MDEVCSRFGGKERLYRILVVNLRVRYHLEDPGVDGRIILRWKPAEYVYVFHTFKVVSLDAWKTE